MSSPFDRPLGPQKGVLMPPPSVFAVVVLMLVLGAIGTLASYLPGPAPLDVTLPLIEVALVAFAVAVWRLFLTRTYAWATFFAVARPAFWASATGAGIVELTFRHDDTTGWSFAILSTGLVLIALDLPLLLGYSVARHVPMPEPEKEAYPIFGSGSTV
jgi:hypothetical protein